MRGPLLERYAHNPIITRQHVPDLGPHLRDVSSVFNPGAVRFGQQTLLVVRVQNRGRETFLMLARSHDGIHFDIEPKLIQLEGIDAVTETIYHIYDARITAIGADYYLMFAMDMAVGCRLGLAHTTDFLCFRFLGIVSQDDNRNGVLFPEKVGGRYLRLDRPNGVRLASGVATGDGIWLSASSDLLNWEPQQEVLAGRWHYWDELIGAGPPPLKTHEGWLLLYHGVATHLNTGHIYQAGVALLDLHNPARVLARGRYNILEPREPYELMGQVPNVVFPSGWTADHVDADGFTLPHATISVYYGAADTQVALAFTSVAALVSACREE